MSNKALLYGLSAAVALAFMFGCQANSSTADSATQARITGLEERISKLENAIREKDAVIGNLPPQASTPPNQNDSLATEFHQFKLYAENRFAISDIDTEKLMWNVWISIGSSAADYQYLSERYGDYSKFGVPRNPAFINRPVLCNKLVNKVITSETTPYGGHE